MVRDGNDVQKEKASGVLFSLAVNAANQEKIAAAGGIPPLIALVWEGNEEQKENAAGALWNLAENAANQEMIAAAGGIPPLVGLVQYGYELQNKNDAGALFSLTVHAGNQEKIGVAGEITPLDSTIFFLLCFIIVEFFLKIAVGKEKSAGALLNLAVSAANQEETAAIGGTGPLIGLIREGTDDQKESAVRYLSHHADPKTKGQVLLFGGVEALLSLVHKSDNGQRLEDLEALLSLCVNGDETIRASVVKAGGREILSKLSQSDEEKIKTLAGQVLTWLTGDLHEISALCKAMNEAEPLCLHVLERLQSLLDRGIHTVATVKNRLRALLTSNKGKPGVFRLVRARALVDSLADLHREIDVIDSQDDKDLWRSRWETERNAMQKQLFDYNISNFVTELGDDVKSQTEAITLLAHEMGHNKNSYSKDEQTFLYDVATRLAGFSGLQVLPVDEKWFIARHEVEVADASFNGGSCGQIYHGTYMHAPVVIKCIGITSESIRSDFLREVKVWHEASRHPNVVQLYGACHVGTPCFMVCKYIAGGSLPEYLRQQERIGRSCAWQTLLSVTHGLQLLHKRGIIHGDLKGNNILVEGSTAMLTDFGMSCFASESRPQFEKLGAIRWRAPEFISSGVTSFEADVYSLGMCIVEAVTGRLPWGLVPDKAVKWHLKNNNFLQQPECMSKEQWALVCGMCDFDPKKRLKLDDVERRIRHVVEMEEVAMDDMKQMNAKDIVEMEEEPMEDGYVDDIKSGYYT